MVQKYQSPVRVYKKPFELVMAAYVKRFPTCDMIPVFLGSNTVFEEESEDKATHTIERRCKLNVNAPYLLKKVAGCEFVFFIQRNDLNRKERTLKITAHNESFSSRVSVNETCLYSVHPENNEWTIFEQSATLEVKSFFGFESSVEKLAIKQYTSNIKKGKDIMEHFLNQLADEGVTHLPTWLETTSQDKSKPFSTKNTLNENFKENKMKSKSIEKTQRSITANLEEEYISVNLGKLTPIQESALVQLRIWLSETHNGKIPKDDHILRFLSSKEFSLEKSRESLCQSLSWRKQHQIDKLLDSYVPCETIKQYFLGAWHHTDIDGRPVYILRLGQMDTKGLLKSVGEDKILKHILFLMEEGLHKCQQASVDSKKPIGNEIKRLQFNSAESQVDCFSSWTFLVDLEGLSMRHLWRPGIQALLSYMNVIQANYPETMARLLLVRAPRLFPVLWTLLYPFIDEKTSSKFMMYTGNDYLKTGGLIDYIPYNSVPVFLGGSCKSSIPQPLNPIPKTLYMTQTENVVDETLYEKASLYKGLPHEVLIEVKEKDAVITWDFDSIRGDILFSLFYCKDQQLFLTSFLLLNVLLYNIN